MSDGFLDKAVRGAAQTILEPQFGNPLLPTGGFLLLLVAYLVLVAGNVFEGA